MPALDLEQGPRSLSRYDVVGQHADADPTSRFVTHVGLHNADNISVGAGGEVNAVHMQPPLKQGDSVKVHVAGRVPLTNDEIKEISAWIEEIKDEYEAANANNRRDQYIIDPPWDDESDPITRVRRYRRYSCAGFVLDGHREVEVDLLNIEKGALPEIDQATIADVYPFAAGNPARRTEFGLEGDGPWRIVLPGYILHALNRSTDDIRRGPYQAQSGNELY